MAEFKDVYGQEELKKYFKGVLTARNAAHAYVLSGEKGSGKKMLAEIFARALQCEEGGSEPCGKCHACRQALAGTHPDIVHVQHEKPGIISVDEIRRQVVNDMSILPYSGKYKIYLVDEAEKMNAAAQNALLKTLEEPPAYGVILLLVSSAGALLPTITSRSVVLNMRPVADAEILRYLKNELAVDGYRAQLCTAFSRGNVGRAGQLAVDQDAADLQEQVLRFLREIPEAPLSELNRQLKAIRETTGGEEALAELPLYWYRDVLLYKADETTDSLIFREELTYIKRDAARLTYVQLEQIMETLDRTAERLKMNVNSELALQLMCLTLRGDSVH